MPRITPGRSCLECQRRKIKCNRSAPCGYCVKTRIRCVYPPGRPGIVPADGGAGGSVISRIEAIEKRIGGFERGLEGIRRLIEDGRSDRVRFGEAVSVSLHPSPVVVSFLWQTYLETVDPVLKIFHVPTVQRHITAVMRGRSVDERMECLVFAIYYSTVVSLSAKECLDELEEKRSVLLKRYRTGFEDALSKANLADMTVLQAFVLYLICGRRDEHGPDVSARLRTAIDAAFRMNLHHETPGISPFEVEMRRRLWWHIYILDVRTAEDTGSEPSIQASSFNTRLPLNIDDASLHPDMAEPVGRVGKTEMLFTLTRFKVSNFARQMVFSDQFCRDNGYTILSPVQKCNAIDEFRQQMEDEYLSHCDKKIPFDFITVAATRLILVKLKLTVTKQRTAQNSLSQGNFQQVCVEVLQHAQKLRLYERGQRWLWLFQTYVEWDALGYLLIDLCAFQNEAAWSVADEVYQYWKNHDIRDQRWRQIEELYSQAEASREVQLDNSAGVSPSSHDPSDPSESVDEAPAFGTACEWNVGMFERYFQVLDTQTTWL